MQPGDLVIRIIPPAVGYAVLLRDLGEEFWDILCADGMVRTIRRCSLRIITE
jgi:hypothetical protein